jgi:hypothetical protein
VQDDAANESSVEGDVQIDPAVAEQEVNEEQEDSVGESEDELIGEAGEKQGGLAQPEQLRRSTRVTSKPDRFDPAAYIADAEFSTEVTLTDEPKTLKEIQLSPDWELWQQAMNEEMKALMEKGVYEWVEKPTHKTPLPAKWVFKIKRDKQGAVEKYKARLVAKGFMQKPGVDYDEVFASSSSLVTLRLLLSFAVQKEYEIHQIDVKTAFLNGELTEEVYLHPPEGYETQQGKCGY